MSENIENNVEQEAIVQETVAPETTTKEITEPGAEVKESINTLADTQADAHETVTKESATQGQFTTEPEEVDDDSEFDGNTNYELYKQLYKPLEAPQQAYTYQHNQGNTNAAAYGNAAAPYTYHHNDVAQQSDAPYVTDNAAPYNYQHNNGTLKTSSEYINETAQQYTYQQPQGTVQYANQNQFTNSHLNPGQGYGIAGLILGIVGIFVPLIGLACAIVGLILSITGLNKSKAVGAPYGVSMGGIIVSCVGVLFGSLWAWFFISLIY
ncbi:MAG: DUF4190 domain-containing protein [Lachnospiraceae bacterium]|jgi:hypothetical protein|nr:DUF4190 domain-containing protein [Lachnospiraceae bacterium]